MLSGWSKQLNLTSWGSAQEPQESAVPDPDEWRCRRIEWHDRLYKTDQPEPSEHPHWEIMPDFRPIQSLCAIQLHPFRPILWIRKTLLLAASVPIGRATMALLHKPFLDRIWREMNLVRSFGFPLLKRGREVLL
jgi:hypothetical protein